MYLYVRYYDKKYCVAVYILIHCSNYGENINPVASWVIRITLEWLTRQSTVRNFRCEMQMCVVGVGAEREVKGEETYIENVSFQMSVSQRAHDVKMTSY